MQTIKISIKVLSIVLPLLVSVAFFTVMERKIIGAIQRRRGPNTLGFFGIFQAFADGLKLLTKETILPSSANKKLFIIAPIITFILSMIGWAVIPLGPNSVLSDINLGVIYLFAISSLGVYGIIIAGWSSNSKYAFLGALRSAAQIISYEVSIGFIMLSVLLSAGTINCHDIILAQHKIWYCFPILPICIIFFISSLAETNRHPFDLPEAEAELVSGYNVEYSAIGFALFFLGEYGNIILISCLNVILFIGGWLLPQGGEGNTLIFGIKVFIFLILFIWARAAYPRFRYDQLIRLGWKVFLPLSLSWVVLSASILIAFNWLP